MSAAWNSSEKNFAGKAFSARWKKETQGMENWWQRRHKIASWKRKQEGQKEGMGREGERWEVGRALQARPCWRRLRRVNAADWQLSKFETPISNVNSLRCLFGRLKTTSHCATTRVVVICPRSINNLCAYCLKSWEPCGRSSPSVWEGEGKVP